MQRKNRQADGNTQCANPTRREFLQGTTAAAVGMLAGSRGQAADSGLLPTVPFAGQRVTRLIVGNNPIYGYSHINRLLSQHMVDYFTQERVVRFLLDCEKAGINTWQTSYDERLLPLIREAGCKMNWIFLAAPEYGDRFSDTSDKAFKRISVAAPAKPIAFAHHGEVTDRLWRAGKLDLIKTFINKVHDLGYPAGISTHNPKVVETVEEKGWNNDYYMTCFYRVTRLPEDFQKEIGVEPVGETYLSTDPERMCQMVRQVKKTCLGFKILAAGRKCDSSEQVREAFKFAFKNIKPTDATIVGMFPRFSDQITENARLVRELAA